MSSTRTILLVFFLSALFFIAEAHGGHKRSSSPNVQKTKRAIANPSSCSYMQCAPAGGSCSSTNSLMFCPVGQYCDGSNCVANIAAGIPCNLNAPEDPCAEGSCVDSGNGGGPMCQIYREILPGNPCTADSQCYYSDAADGVATVPSTCNAGTCRGQTATQTCVASHQCVVGTFCQDSSKTCQPLGDAGAICKVDGDCNPRFTCLSDKCTSRYSQGEGQVCKVTENCGSGLYCKSGACAKAPTPGRTTATCDIASNSGCASNQQCSCNGFTTPSQTATCAAIKGTADSMFSIEQGAYKCMDDNKCGWDVNNATTVNCITSKCTADYCTYFTRNANDLFTQYPDCLLARMVSSPEYFKLLTTCRNYQPTETAATSTTGTSAASSLSAPILLIFLSTLFFFGF